MQRLVFDLQGGTMEPVIETQGLTHVYIDADNNQVTALGGIDLQIMPGEFVAVIGANGSGKSTLARHFNALLLPIHVVWQSRCPSSSVRTR